MKRIGYVLTLVIMTSLSSNAQKYLVRFTDKTNPAFSLSDPSAFLSQRAIDRRTLYAIPLDSTDLPVNPAYLDSLRSIPGVTVLNASKWLNQVSVQVANAGARNRIAQFPFVMTASPIASRMSNNSDHDVATLGKKRKAPKPKGTKKANTNFFSYGRSFNQIHLHNGEFLHNIGLRGQDMIIGMLDAGFFNYTSLSAFDSVNNNGQILGTWDFISNNAGVADDDAHGMQCLSIIAGNVPGTFVGSAPKANFYLFRTENTASEYPIEEHDWVCAAERLDSAGGDVISSSLGYFQFDDPKLNYTYADMDGNTTISARGADLAAKKGILVVNAMGNEGNSNWRYLSTPADGDSVLTVGAVTMNGLTASLSGYGPTSDGQVKPDAAAVGAGTWIQYPNNTFGVGSGTSFACPMIAGLATCLWQGFKEFNNMTILNAIRQAGSIASNPNDRIGYGVPDVKKAVVHLLKQFSTVSAAFNNCSVTIKWTSKDISAMKYEVERKAAGDSEFRKIAELSGTGTVFSNNTYELTDILSKVDAGKIAYRIRQVIDSASSSFLATYLDTVSVDVQPSCALPGQINVFPNPAQGRFTLQTAFEEAEDNLRIVIFNAAGQTILTQKEKKPSGTFNYIINTPQLSDGRYFVSVYKGNKLIETKELVILK